MYIIKNALRCVGRSKGRNILIGIIVFVIAVSACIGLSIRQAAQGAKEETLSDMTITATISIDRQAMMSNMSGGEGGFDKSQFSQKWNSTSTLTLDDYQKYAEAESVQDFYYSLTASLNGTEAFEAISSENESEFDDKRGNGKMGRMEMSSGDFTVVGYSAEIAMISFVNGTAGITEGTVFEEGSEAYDCIISQELATYNDVSVGDVITLVNPNAEEDTYALSVVGIYESSDSNEGSQMMLGSDPANEIYMSYTSLNKIITASEEGSTTVTDEDTGREYETGLSGSLSSTYVFADTEAYNHFEDEVRELGLDNTYTVSSQDISSFENSLVPLNTLSTMAGWFLIVILIIGAIILIVMNIFNIRERKYEIGVLMAIGMKKRNVALQFLTEIFVVTIVAVFLGVGVGAVSAVPVTNALLEQQIESAENESSQIEKNFGRGEMTAPENVDNFGGDKGSMKKPDGDDFAGIRNMFGESTANYISEINSAMNFTVVLQMLGIAILLTLISGIVSILFVTRYEPLKILSNRD